MKQTSYESPLGSRYSSKEMSFIFSPQFKYSTWRRLWVVLAKIQKKLGLQIEEKQIKELEKKIEEIDFELASKWEKQYRHDVMAHIQTYLEQCPSAKGILHLGATSAFVTDNADLIQMKEALQILSHKFVTLLRLLSDAAKKYAGLVTLSYTHLQAAQPTTVGKRICLWLQDFLIDFQDLLARENDLGFLGVKGATGTQASFLALFEGDERKVVQLEKELTKTFDFTRILSISGQTYTRKQDMRVLAVLEGLAASAHKCATDLRLLMHLHEMEEPFESEQVGSSAMPHKRNPMRSERVCGLSRYLISLRENPAYTHATQWLERTLDDSANRRLCIPEAFLCADSILNLLINIAAGWKVYPKVIEKNLQAELPFLSLEAILIKAVKKGHDRQKIHEHLRNHAHQVVKRIKEEGKQNDLLQRLEKDKMLGLSKKEIEQCLNVKHLSGRAKEQVENYLKEEVQPFLQQFKKSSIKSSVVEI